MNMWTKSIKLWLNEFTLLLLLHFRCQHRNRQEVDSIFYKSCQHLATVLRIRLSSCASTPLLPSPSSSVPIYSCRISSVACNLCTGEVVHNCFKFLVSEVPCMYCYKVFQVQCSGSQAAQLGGCQWLLSADSNWLQFTLFCRVSSF